MKHERPEKTKRARRNGPAAFLRGSITASAIASCLLLTACSTPTLVQVARRRQATTDDMARTRNVKDDVRVKYHVTDMDVLNFTDEVKRKLANRAGLHMGGSYGFAGTQATLGALAGAAKTIGWGTGAASGLGLGATYVFGMGQIFDSKAHAQAYEQASTAIQAAEANFYFRRLGMSFEKEDGRTVVVVPDTEGRCDIPSRTHLTPDGETLYYRTSKILKVLNDTLASRIPDLQDLKDAHGEGAGIASPLIPKGAIRTSSGGGFTVVAGDGSSAGNGKLAAEGEGRSSSNTSNGSQGDIPEQLRPRNERLEMAFKPLTDEQAAKRLESKGLFAPSGVSAKEHLAKVILAKADFPLLKKQSALNSLTYYRQHATDDATTTKLENAYRELGLLQPPA